MDEIRREKQTAQRTLQRLFRADGRSGGAWRPDAIEAWATAQRTLKGDARDDVGRGTTAKAESGKKTGGERKQQRKKFLGIF